MSELHLSRAANQGIYQSDIYLQPVCQRYKIAGFSNPLRIFKWKSRGLHAKKFAKNLHRSKINTNFASLLRETRHEPKAQRRPPRSPKRPIARRLSFKQRVDSLAQLVEHNTFNVGVVGSSPTRITWGSSPKHGGDSFFVPIPIYHSTTYIL